ncbi:HD domain-containing phosphohydrolase [Cellvibrio japonicus]|nr:HD domain-containing phosphohydrolase [Cellvibrio japonicus]
MEIAQALMMLIPGLPDSVGLAVLEHQERCDGTGYPAAKLDSELSLLGQLLALADSVVAIYFNRLLPYGRGWRDAIPIIERSAQEYLFRAVDLLSALVRRSDLPVASVVSGSAVTDFLQQFHSQHERLQCWFDALKGCLLEIGFTHRDRRLHSLQNVVLHLATAYKGVVAQQPALDRQLVNLMEQPATEIPQDLQDHCLLQLEVVFHLRRLSLMLQQYLAAGGSADELIQSKLEACFGQISGYLEQSVDR